MRATSLAWAMACGLAASGPALAADRWDSGGITDNGPFTRNELRHGVLQPAHDFSDALDEDWAVIVTQARRSYEARVGSGTVNWMRVPPGPLPICGVCARFDRVDATGAVLTAGTTDSSTHPSAALGWSSSARWIAAADAQEYLRALPGQQIGDNYDLQFFDTSYLVPRFNNSGTQVTVLLVQNGSRSAVDAQVHFYDSAGTLRHSQPLSLPVQGNVVFNTASVSALQNVSGTAVLAHTAPYGMLSGKAVALEPATGFTFDTPLAPIPY